MNTEERLLRLENAFATLSELAAKSNGRHDGADDRLDKLLTWAVSTDDRLDKLLMLAVSADERMTQQTAWINELGAAQANADARIAALADAQIRTEGAQANADARIAALADAQANADARIAALADAQIRTEGAQANAAVRMAALAETVERIISERRNGKH